MKVLFDITRLAWSAHRVSPSGIDRVVAAYGRWLNETEDFEVAPVSHGGGRFSPVSKRRFRRLLTLARASGEPSAQAQAAWTALNRALAADFPGRTVSRLPAAANDPAEMVKAFRELASHWRWSFLRARPCGDIYLNVAHAGMENSAFLAELAARGIASVVMIHDLIPLTHPEYCTANAHVRHKARIDAVLAHASLVIANSQTTAQALIRYAAERGAAAPSVVAAPLGLEPPFLRAPAPGSHTAPYFVCVGTIEARKNLTFLLAIWRRLAEEMGPETPQLVLIGLRGWENEAVIDHLERGEAIRPFVHEVSGLHDDHLAQLIFGARALLAPSLVEGFDLPLMEALSLGTPAIASDIPVHRELARGALLVDPLDGPAWIGAIKAACVAAPRPAPAAGPTWDSHFAVVGGELARLKA